MTAQDGVTTAQELRGDTNGAGSVSSGLGNGTEPLNVLELFAGIPADFRTHRPATDAPPDPAACGVTLPSPTPTERSTK